MKMRIADFCVDITPPVGAPLAYVPNDKIDSPIYVRGLVIDDGEKRAVWVSSDIISYWGSAYHATRRLIAKAAGTTPGRVFLHVVHQHDSMRFAPQFNPIYAKFGAVCIPPDYYTDVNNRLRDAVAAAVRSRAGSWKVVKNISTAESRVAGLASNRRIIDETGKCVAMRFSMCTDESLKKLPVGEIDPLLRTVAFEGTGGQILAALHFYASHPMGAYRRNQVGSDVPGVALKTVSKLCDPDTFHVYFTGCAGNITFGKYHLNGDCTIKVLGERLGNYMAANMGRLETRESAPLKFATTGFEMKLAKGITEEIMSARLEKAKDLAAAGTVARRLLVARNWKSWSRISVMRMSLGPSLHLLSLPAETMIEYQLYAQSLVPEQFLAVAAYNNLTYGYIPTEKMFDEGGYEPDVAAICTREVEAPYREAIAKSLSALM